jgi:hypothetical protein
MSTKLYAVNKTEANLILKGGYLNIPKGGYKVIHPSDEGHPDVIHALNQEPAWLEITSVQPTATPVSGPDISYYQGYTGMTEAELLASKGQKKEEVKEQTITPIGRPSEDAAPSTITPIGASAETVQQPDTKEEAQPEVQSEDKPKRGRKAKAEEGVAVEAESSAEATDKAE